MKRFWFWVFVAGTALMTYGGYIIHPGLGWIFTGLWISLLSSAAYASIKETESSTPSKQKRRDIH